MLRRYKNSMLLWIKIRKKTNTYFPRHVYLYNTFCICTMTIPNQSALGEVEYSHVIALPTERCTSLHLSLFYVFCRFAHMSNLNEIYDLWKKKYIYICGWKIVKTLYRWIKSNAQTWAGLILDDFARSHSLPLIFHIRHIYDREQSYPAR